MTGLQFCATLGLNKPSPVKSCSDVYSSWNAIKWLCLQAFWFFCYIYLFLIDLWINFFRHMTALSQVYHTWRQYKSETVNRSQRLILYWTYFLAGGREPYNSLQVLRPTYSSRAQRHIRRSSPIWHIAIIFCSEYDNSKSVLFRPISWNHNRSNTIKQNKTHIIHNQMMQIQSIVLLVIFHYLIQYWCNSIVIVNTMSI